MIRAIVLMAAILLSCNAWATPAFHFFTVEGSNRVTTQIRYPADQTDVQIDGLQPNSIYDLAVTLQENNLTWQSNVEIASDNFGMIDTATSPALSGSYTGKDVDGLFWSMEKVGQTPQSSIGYHFQIELKGTVIATTDLSLGALRPGIKVINLTGTTLVGKLFLPAEPGPHPAVIAFGGSEGGTGTGIAEAELLANAGYAALGIGYFGAPGLPPTLANIPLEYFQNAIQFLQSQPQILKTEIAVMGMSRGGELALLLGATFPEIKAVVADVPSPVKWAGDDYEAGHWLPAWTFHGIALPYISPTVGLQQVTLPDGRTAYDNRPVFEAGLKDAADVARAMSPIEDTNGPIFMIGGNEDEMWPSCDLISLAMARLKEKHHPFEDQAICYPGAGHAVGMPPIWPDMIVTAFQEGPYLFNLGGEPAAIARGQRDAWLRTLGFLKSALPQREAGPCTLGNP